MKVSLRDARSMGGRCLCIAAGLLFAVGARAGELPTLRSNSILQVQCGLPFQDNAVLQQKIPLPVWGTSLSGAKVTVAFAGQTKTAEADRDGKWKVMLDPLTAVKLKSVNDMPDGKVMVITCEKDGQQVVKELKNLLVGEVWLCSGQSNMAGTMGSGTHHVVPTNSVALANYPALRQMVSPQVESWLICTPDTVSKFKKVCFFFARGVQQDLLVPVGIINAAVGGSSIESWLNQAPYATGKNYEAQIAPLEGYGLRGFIWYQGESNVKDGRGYQPKLESLITGWRAAWKQPDATLPDGPHAAFSAYFVQLPGIGTSPTNNPAGGDGRAAIRQAQFETLAVTNSGMVVTLDVGGLGEHPPNKYDTGMRLAYLALHNDYGFKNLAICPLYKRHKIDGGVVRISFDYAQNGLMMAMKEGVLPPKPVPDAKLDWLSIQDKGGAWHWADGRIEGSELVVSCKDVPDPVAVRYAFTIQPMGHLLYNKEGMPVGPFSTNGY